jgi:hypothetical protein
VNGSRTVRDLLREGLDLLGVSRLWGDDLDPDLACLMADADGRVNGGHGAAMVAGGVLHLSSQPGGTAYPRTVESAEELADALGEVAARPVPGTTALHLALDLDAPVPGDLVVASTEARSVVMTLDPMFADLAMGFVVGPGVVRGGHDEQARRFARSAGVPVATSFGAKGVFRWDSPFDGGTIGLQEHDAELAGLGATVDVVIAGGIDPDETSVESLGPVVQQVEPAQLAALTAGWTGSRAAPTERTRLASTLATLLGPRYESTMTPLDPCRAALHLSGAAPAGAVVCGEAGWSGFWLARAFPTGIPGSLVVPATRQAGVSIAMALAARLAGRPAIAVCDGLDDAGATVLELARSLGVGLAVQEWRPDAAPMSTDDHAAASIAAFGADEVTVSEVAVSVDELSDLVEGVGPVSAWGGLAHS